MSKRIVVGCPVCEDADITVTYDAHEYIPATRHSPEEPAFVEAIAVVEQECSCDIDPVDTEEAIVEKLLEEADDEDDNAFDRYFDR